MYFIFLFFFAVPYPLFLATFYTIGIDDGSYKRAYGKSHVHSNIALVHPWQNNERENGMERERTAKSRETRQKTYWAVKGFFGVVCLIGTAV